jgi:hypothetical protein
MALVGRDLSCRTAAKWGLGETIVHRLYEFVPSDRKWAAAATVFHRRKQIMPRGRQSVIAC